ncbi:MAG: hypothetical protein ACRDOE_03395, partial [Streptosporangiaceae bacterium]
SPYLTGKPLVGSRSPGQAEALGRYGDLATVRDRFWVGSDGLFWGRSCDGFGARAGCAST